jgi:hypothetical protein
MIFRLITEAQNREAEMIEDMFAKLNDEDIISEAVSILSDSGVDMLELDGDELCNSFGGELVKFGMDSYKKGFKEYSEGRNAIFTYKSGGLKKAFKEFQSRGWL